MEEWKEYRLGDVISIAGGFAYKGNLIGEGNNYLLSMGCVSFNDNFLDKGARQYNGDSPERFYAIPGDIVLATRQQSDNLPILGMPAIIPQKYEGHKMIVGANLYKVVIKDDSFDNRYLYWLLKTPYYVKHIRSCQSGTTVRMITKANIEDFTFYAPNKECRTKISDFIWSLDDKIENNRKINENLEQQAQALFKSWFVDFEPFRDQPFVESELGMIPEGWRVGTLNEIAEINPNRTLKKGQNAMYLDMKNMPTTGSFPIRWEKKDYSGGMKFQNQDTIMARITPCLENGKVAYINFLDDNEIAFGSTEYIVMTTKDGFIPELLYFLCRDKAFKDYATVNMNGSSGRQRVSGDVIGNYKIVIPPKNIIEPLSNYYKNVMDINRNNGFENLRLSQLRDTLLPKLMSGEIKL